MVCQSEAGTQSRSPLHPTRSKRTTSDEKGKGAAKVRDPFSRNAREVNYFFFFFATFLAAFFGAFLAAFLAAFFGAAFLAAFFGAAFTTGFGAGFGAASILRVPRS